MTYTGRCIRCLNSITSDDGPVGSVCDRCWMRGPSTPASRTVQARKARVIPCQVKHAKAVYATVTKDFWEQMPSPDGPVATFDPMSIPDFDAIPKVFTFPLVEEVAKAAKLSKGKARKAIRNGKVQIDGQVVRDPDVTVHGENKVEIYL